MSAHSQQPMETGQLISSVEDSPAKTLASQEKDSALPANGLVFGTKCVGSLARYAHDTCSWRTSQRSLLEEWEPYSESFPRSGMTRSGTAYQLQPLVPRTGESEFGSWPTPTVCGNYNRKGASKTSGDGLATAVKNAMWPTPTASMMPCEGTVRLCRQRWLEGDATLEEASAVAGRDVRKSQGKVPAMWPTPTANGHGGAGHRTMLQRKVDAGEMSNEEKKRMVQGHGGQLNPQWVEWLMGFPLGWTDLDA